MKSTLIPIGILAFFGGLMIAFCGDIAGIRLASVPHHAVLVRLPRSKRGKEQYYPRANTRRAKRQCSH